MNLRQDPFGSFNDPDMHDLKRSMLSAESYRKSQLKNAKSRKMIIIGLKNSGKTSLVQKFIYGFSGLEETCPEENYNTSITYKEELYQLNIVDLADFDEYTHLYPAKYSIKVDGYIFFYAVDDPYSFQFIQNMREKLEKISGKYLPSILVANKIDQESTREVSTEEGRRLAKAYGIPYREISARDFSVDAVQKVFDTMLREILRAEEQTTIKWLKGWNSEKIDDLYKMFFLANVLLAIVGIFLISFSIANLFMYPHLFDDQGSVLAALVLEGFLLIAVFAIGTYGMKKEEREWISTFSTLLIINFLVTLGIIVLKIMTELPNFEDQPDYGAEYRDLDPIVYGVIIISLFVMVLLFWIAFVSKEIFIKRGTVKKSRFASLKV